MPVMISTPKYNCSRNQRLVQGWLELGRLWLLAVDNLTASSMRACRLSVAARVVHLSLFHRRRRATRGAAQRGAGIEIKTLCGLGYCRERAAGTRYRRHVHPFEITGARWSSASVMDSSRCRIAMRGTICASPMRRSSAQLALLLFYLEFAA